VTRIGYLASEYPARSHTFIRREIAALKARGLVIVPFSVRPATVASDEPVPSILGQGWWRCIASAVAELAASPGRVMKTWLLALEHRPAGLRGLIWAHFHLVEALALAGMLRRADIERLHSHFANSGATVGMLAADYLRIPWSLTLHGISETDGSAGMLLPQKLERAEFVACASWFMRAQAMRVTPVELWSKFHVVRCGVDFTSMPPSGHRSGTGPTRFVTVGRMSSEKGQPGLLEALKDVLSRGIDSSLTIVGDGPLMAELRSQIEALGLGDHVKLEGALPETDTLAMIAQGDVFVLPSLMEGLPVVLLEAMALRKPVIAPAVAGIPELVADRDTGLLFRPGDWAQLAERMAHVASDETTREHLARRARERVEAEFDINAAVEPLAALLTGTATPSNQRPEATQSLAALAAPGPAG
jgi:glycosyltransferase involved in cell wall biosynthesis